jgi:hypothetical protein
VSSIWPSSKTLCRFASIANESANIVTGTT